MSDRDDLQRECQFDTLLSEAERWGVAPGPPRHAAGCDETVAADLALVAALRETRPERAEVEFARVRIGLRLTQLMEADAQARSASAASCARAGLRARLRAVTMPPRLAPASARTVALARVWMRHAGPLVAALLIVIFASFAGASAASAQALPESPFYGVKRAEEAVLLAISWGDVSKGETLTMIANHRLIEASAEADQLRTNEARGLLSQFDGTFAQLIDMAKHAQTQHEDITTLARGIVVTVETEQSIATRAATHGHKAFAQAASASATAAAARMYTAGIGIQAGPGQNNGRHNGQGGGQGQGGPSQTPSAKPTRTPRDGATPAATPSSTSSPISSSTPSSMPPSPTRPSGTRTKNGSR